MKCRDFIDSRYSGGLQWNQATLVKHDSVILLVPFVTPGSTGEHVQLLLCCRLQQIKAWCRNWEFVTWLCAHGVCVLHFLSPVQPPLLPPPPLKKLCCLSSLCPLLSPLQFPSPICDVLRVFDLLREFLVCYILYFILARVSLSWRQWRLIVSASSHRWCVSGLVPFLGKPGFVTCTSRSTIDQSDLWEPPATVFCDIPALSLNLRESLFFL